MTWATLGVIIGNRDFFPDALVSEARADVLALFDEMDIEAVMVDGQATKLGGVETRTEAKICAELFRRERERIEGIVVVLPNFGDEKGVADTMRLSGLDVPILVQAYPDDVTRFGLERRRDAFCGKISVCSDLRQYGFDFSLTEQHTVTVRRPPSAQTSSGSCVSARSPTGCAGASRRHRHAAGCLQDGPLQREAPGSVRASASASSTSPRSSARRASWPTITHASSPSSTTSGPTSPTAMYRPTDWSAMARLGVVIDDWMSENDLDATAIQCWHSLQDSFGVNVCTLMSMMSTKMMPSACETDITGLASMYALQLAAGEPTAIVDLNNNYGDDPDRCVLFHCGNWPLNFYTRPRSGPLEILGTTLGEENVWGAINGRAPAAPLTIARISTDDVNGRCKAYVAEGRFIDEPLETFGSRAVVEIPNFQPLLKHICRDRLRASLRHERRAHGGRGG